MKTVIIVNGRPRAGKDTVVQTMTKILKSHGVETEAFSSIDPVRWMLSHAGFDLREKTPEDRALLAEVGCAVEKHSRWRSQQCFVRIYHLFTETREQPAVMFLHVREPAVIEGIRQRVEKRGWKVLSILVKSPREEHVTSNAADLGVEGMSYDTSINNDGTIDDLKHNCRQLLFQQAIITQLSLLR